MAEYSICSPDTPIEWIKKYIEQDEAENQPIYPIVHYKTNKYLGYVTRNDVIRYCEEFPDIGWRKVIDIFIWCMKRGCPRIFCIYSGEKAGIVLAIMKANKLKFIPMIAFDQSFLGIVEYLSVIALLK